MIQHFFHCMLWMWVSVEDRCDYDYSEWLGPGYKEKQKLPLKVSTHIGAPHACWLDDTLMQFIENHAFAVKDEAQKVPLLADILKGMQVFYIDRTSGDAAVKQIIEKQEAVEKDHIIGLRQCFRSRGY